MRDVVGEIRRWYEAGETFGLATVVETFRSAPRPPGAAMAVSAGGEVVGSVSGGCVEGAVYELAQEVISTGEPILRAVGYAQKLVFRVLAMIMWAAPVGAFGAMAAVVGATGFNALVRSVGARVVLAVGGSLATLIVLAVVLIKVLGLS